MIQLIAFLCFQMQKILSIDLDALWEGTDTIYRDPGKKLDHHLFQVVKSLSECTTRNLEVGIDHHQICLLLDDCSERFEIDHLDAHHDLYAENYISWLNPLFIRGRRVNIGNFLFQLLRERSLTSMHWLIPSGMDPEASYREIQLLVGNFYSQKVKVSCARHFQFSTHYDLIFISLSPEWIPISDLPYVTEILKDFKFSSDTIETCINAMLKRWDCGDDPFLTRKDRFYFDYSYK